VSTKNRKEKIYNLFL